MAQARYGRRASFRLTVLALAIVMMLGTIGSATGSTVALVGVKVSPGNQRVTAGQTSANYSTTVMFGNGGSGGTGSSTAALTISAATPLPAGASATFTPSSVAATAAGNQTSTLAISTVCGTTTPGTYTFTVTATGTAGDATGTVVKSGNETLTVNTCAPTLNNVNVSPAQNPAVAGQPSPKYIATVSFNNPFPPAGGSDVVTLSIKPPSPFPAGTAVTFTPPSVTGLGNPPANQTSSLIIVVPCGTPTEDLDFWVLATDDVGVIRTSNALTLKVTAAAACATPTATATATPTPTATATPTATPTVSVSGAAIQNGMNGAAITAASVNPDGSDSSTLGAATADGNGNFSMVIAPPPTGPVRFRASGGSYLSEQDGATISSPSPLSALLPSLHNNLSGLSINPLTTFVDSLALGNVSRGQNLATALTNSTTSIENDYSISTDPATLTPLYTPAAVGTDAGRLGLILGAIVNEDELACPSTPGGLVTALSSDISDGIFDGMNSATPVPFCGSNLAAIAGSAQFSDALSGLQELALATSGFTFGGINNALTLNGVSASDVASEAATIETALVATAPPSINTFAASTPSMNAARCCATSTLLPNGKVLIAGGATTVSEVNTTELYDPATNTFAASTPVMNVARSFATATLLPNGKVLIANGFDASSNAVKSVDLYDPVTNTFAVSTPLMNTARVYTTATLLPNGKVLIAGGITNGPGGGINFGLVLNTTELYDPVTNTFALTTPLMNTPRHHAKATLLPNGKVLIAGGTIDGANFLSSTELYDPVSNTFAAVTPSMNTGSAPSTQTLLPNGKVLISGNSASYLTSTELYDTLTNSFAATTPSIITATTGPTGTLLANGKVLIAGGASNAGFFNNGELYDPVSNTFVASPGMNTARESATAVLLPNGKVLIAGGNGNAGYLDSTELYTP